jgi:GH35 family endo-1,4-beta-xylanase
MGSAGFFVSSRRASTRGAVVAAVVCVAALGAACTVPVAAPAPASAPPATTARTIGMSFTGDVLTWSGERLEADFRAARDLGVTWARIPMHWSTLEGDGRGLYEWEAADRAVFAARRFGLNVIAVVSYAPTWARPARTNAHHPPINVADYGNFLAAAATRYRGSVRAWEIWNEPNISAQWLPRPNIAKYTALLKTAYLRVKAIDPTALVLNGGLSPAADAADRSSVRPVTFVRGIYDRGGKGYFDALAHHPATFPHPVTTPGDWNAFQQTRELHDEMRARGNGAKKV